MTEYTVTLAMPSNRVGESYPLFVNDFRGKIVSNCDSGPAETLLI